MGKDKVEKLLHRFDNDELDFKRWIDKITETLDDLSELGLHEEVIPIREILHEALDRKINTPPKELKQYQWEKLLGLKKSEIAKLCIPKEMTFDFALPQKMLDDVANFCKKRGETVHSKREDGTWKPLNSYTYDQILSTTFMIYPKGSFGLMWSACKEIDAIIKGYFYGGK